jgi:hypothetical protein
VKFQPVFYAFHFPQYNNLAKFLQVVEPSHGQHGASCEFKNEGLHLVTMLSTLFDSRYDVSRYGVGVSKKCANNATNTWLH